MDCYDTKVQFMRGGFDIDGVIHFGKDENGEYIPGIRPGPSDVIITGRSIEESYETYQFLDHVGIPNYVYFNQLPFDQKTRFTSGQHEGNTIKELNNEGYNIGIFFEDDEIQIKEILKIVPDIRIVHVKSNLIEKENVRHDY